MIIDSHQHFWRLETGFYDWIPPADAALRRDFGVADLAPELSALGISGTVLVQAANTEEELPELAALAAASCFVLGIVGPLEVDRADVAARIAAMAALPLVVGFRPPFTPLFDTGGSLTENAETALAAIEQHGLVFDCLAVGPALGLIPTLAQRFESVPFVVDHGGNPNLSEGMVSLEWRKSMEAIARQPNAVCKLSGLLTRLPAGHDTSLLAEHVSILLELFGPSRLLWGSDWPVLTKAGSYSNWLDLSRALLSHLSGDETAAVFGGNAARIYKLGGRNGVAV